MACHEIAALRLGLMQVIGIEDEAAKQHEINEIGMETLNQAGPIRSLTEAKTMLSLKNFFESSLVELEEKLATTSSDDPQLPYYRSLLVLTKKVEMDLHHTIENMENLYRDLDEMHDFVHEIYPGG